MRANTKKSFIGIEISSIANVKNIVLSQKFSMVSITFPLIKLFHIRKNHTPFVRNAGKIIKMI